MFDKLKQKTSYPIYETNEDNIEWGIKLGEGISSVYKIKYEGKTYAGKLYEKPRKKI